MVVSLLQAVPALGTIMAYSNYERTVLKGLSLAFPQYEDRLMELCDRIVDLHRLVRRYYYHSDGHLQRCHLGFHAGPVLQE